MNAVFRLFLFALPPFLTAVCGCSAPGPVYDFDTQARFNSYQTFSWLEPAVEGPKLIQPVEELIVESVNKDLESKGLRLVDNSGDLLIIYHPGFREKIVVGSYGYDYWPARWGFGAYFNGADQYIYPKGTLIIDLVDRRKNHLIWRGSTDNAIKSGAAEKQVERINQAVAEILANYPPPYRR